MNTNIQELSMNEMEQVLGGGACSQSARRKLRNMVTGWLSDTVAPACEKTAKAACNVSKAAINWVRGLFD